MASKEKNNAILVVTWWPCAWKTTGMSHTIQKFAWYWRETLVWEEAATILMKAWMRPGGNISYEDFQHKVIIEQLHREKILAEQAERMVKWGKKVLTLLDRWLMDGGAYIPRDDFYQVLKEHHIDPDQVLRDRYDWVIHLVTAADGAPAFYTTTNNTVRTETLEEAKEKDYKTQHAWNGTDKLRIIQNKITFEEKLQETVQAIAHILWIPIPYEIEDKFAVKQLDWSKLKALNPIIAHLTQFYISSPTQQPWEIRRARKLVQWSFEKYFLTIKTLESIGKNGEIEDSIPKDTYKLMHQRKVPWSKIIQKDRYTFIDNKQYFEFDVFKEPENALKLDDVWLLELEKTDVLQEVIIPDFMKVVESTGDKRYSNAVIAWLKL